MPQEKISPDWVKMEEQLHKDLTEDRYRHTLGVTYTACALAMRWGADLQKARLAGLLHDCAKCIPNDEKIRICREEKLDATPFELQHTALLHAKLGPYIAKTRYGVTDPEIQNAILWHTTGRSDMTLLEKIIFTADYIEPNRDRAPRLSELRALAFTDLDACVTEILSDTLQYLSRDPDAVDPMTKTAYDWYSRQHA